MNLKAATTLLIALLLMVTLGAEPASSGRTQFLSVCQEIMNQARSNEARATYHNQVCTSLKQQIDNMARQPKNPGTISAIDNLFAQYDENRALESKFRELYRQATDEAKQCMKNAE